jgi:hypothetical protein
MKGLIKAVLITGAIYAIGSFICSTWDPMKWHWIMKVVGVLWAIGAYDAIEKENR